MAQTGPDPREDSGHRYEATAHLTLKISIDLTTSNRDSEEDLNKQVDAVTILLEQWGYDVHIAHINLDRK
jgi:hypothetical protein